MIALISFSYPNDGRKLKKLIQGLVQGKMVACAQIINYVHSYYIREGKLTKNNEKLVICKTTLAGQPKALQFISKSHPYQTPEILTQHIDCNQLYQERVESMVR